MKKIKVREGSSLLKVVQPTTSSHGLLEAPQGSLDPRLKTTARAALLWVLPVSRVVIYTTLVTLCGPEVVRSGWNSACAVPSGAHQVL